MRYNRLTLIEACDRALQADREHWEIAHVERFEEHIERKDAWLRQNGEAWAAAGLAVRRAVREGRPVTRDLIPWNDRFGQPVVFSPDANLNRKYQAPKELTFLRHILDVVLDDEVSTSGLEKIGVNTNTMRAAAWHMATGTAKER